MNEPLIHPHDALFKLFMQDKQIAQHFMQRYLPQEIKILCDFDSLQLQSGSFVEPNLRQKFSDILYAVNIAEGSGYIYCLIEHQSTPDNMIAFRLMHYAMMAMERHLKHNRDAKLPLVIPMLFYCGTSAHPKSITLNWLDHFCLPDFAKMVYTAPFKLIDIHAMDDSELKRHQKIGLLEYLFKYIHTRDLMQMIEQINQFLLVEHYSNEIVEAVLFYLYNHGRIDDPKKLAEQLLASPNQYQESIMNFAQYLEQRGLEKGLEQGSYETALAIAKKMLAKGADIDFIESTTGLTEEQIKQLVC